jgi:uncharacterized protein YbaP (TraB family)
MISRMLTVHFLLLLALSADADSSSVWRVQNNSSTLYLAGTVHLLRPHDYPLPDVFETAYRDSQLLVFEMDLRDARTPDFQRLMVESMRLSPGNSLSALLRADTLQKLELQLQKNGMGINQFSGLKPAMIAMTLTVMELQKLGAGSAGVDEFFHARAVSDGKRISALETAEQQIQMLASMGKGHEDELIRQTLDELDHLQDDFDAILSAWRAGDRKRLKTLFIDPMKHEFSPVYKELLVDRNNHWIPQIRQMLETRETEMVLVGSGHLIGEDGLLQRLENAGYRISQLE